MTTGPLRTDLPFLRHRRGPAAPSPTARGPEPAVLEAVVIEPEAGTGAPANTHRAGWIPEVPAVYRPARTKTAGPTVLTREHPTVVLTRLQSGIGSLTAEAAWLPVTQPLLGCLTHYRDGRMTMAVPNARLTDDDAVLLASRPEYQRLTVDLLRAQHIERLVLFAVLHQPLPATWAGTLVLTTTAGTRIELPIDPAPAPGTAVLMSLHNVDGELVVRAEPTPTAADPREAAQRFGFDRLSWRDAYTPLV